ncbi:hypothetical protein [Natronogracilivirga saccharolytica]|uniref:Uncharacterized protein n=1 Tax=Natronogracilivirga saccharolytica TaxID=2812953 RepID=A0A8J7S9C7_9BACT|nr:hypothetical protein [Natronogracilivirga saccharolytica]MBP3192773.1 hypothetical protein [Natronogracilivirga saccharolytica]
MGDRRSALLQNLSPEERTGIHGGGVITTAIVSFLSATAFHTLKEAYNDWEAHVEAFNEGRESMQ